MNHFDIENITKYRSLTKLTAGDLKKLNDILEQERLEEEQREKERLERLEREQREKERLQQEQQVIETFEEEDEDEFDDIGRTNEHEPEIRMAISILIGILGFVLVAVWINHNTMIDFSYLPKVFTFGLLGEMLLAIGGMILVGTFCFGIVLTLIEKTAHRLWEKLVKSRIASSMLFLPCVALFFGVFYWFSMPEHLGAYALKKADYWNMEESMPWYEIATKCGNGEAMYELGNVYYNGQFLETDYEKAYDLFVQSAETGYEEAYSRVGYCYGHGLGVDKDYDMALEWYKKAVDADIAEGYYYMGECYFYGYGLETDYNKAREYYEKGADKDHGTSYYALGKIYYEGGYGTYHDYEKAIEYFEKAAKKNVVTASYYLGQCYEKGLGVEKDLDKAIEYYKEGAKYEEGLSKQRLKELEGDVTETLDSENTTQAVASETTTSQDKSKEQDLTEGEKVYNQAYAYYKGTDGVKQDYDKAFELFQESANLGHVKAVYMIGYCYLYGYGVEDNDEKAVEYFEKAYEEGSYHAAFFLGACYYHGFGVEVNQKKAVGYLETAAESGMSGAMDLLGICYEGGDGVKKNQKKAIEYYKMAAEKGNKNSQKRLKELGIDYE